MLIVLKVLFLLGVLITLSSPRPHQYDVISFPQYETAANKNNNQAGVVTPDNHENKEGYETYSEEEKEKEKEETNENNNNGVGIVVPDEEKKDSTHDSHESYHSNMEIKLPDNGQLFEGDIVMDERFRRMVGGKEKSKKSAVARLDEMDLKWPKGVIPYEIDVGFHPNQRKMLEKAMTEYINRTCIRFKRRKNEVNYVFFTNWKDECSSNIGMSGGRQNITLGRDCHVLGTYEHEIMHALGFIHEHSRPDRDEYIKILYSNIKKAETVNFQKYRFRQIETWNMPFNFASIMLYRNNAFSKDGKDTIIARSEPDLKFGQRIKFSAGDIKEINTLYHCTQYLKKPNYHGLFKEYHTRKGNKYEESLNEKQEKKIGWMLRYLLGEVEKLI